MVPDDALRERIDDPDDDGGSEHLRPEPRALGDSAGNNRGHRRGEGGKEEEADQREAVQRKAGRAGRKVGGADEEGDAVRDPIAEEEIADCRKREVRHDLDHRIYLVLASHRADLEKGEAAMHGKDQDRPDQKEEDVETDARRIHLEAPRPVWLTGIVRPQDLKDRARWGH